MDGKQQKRGWQWMAEHMPRVVALLKEERAAGRGAHVDECWRRGVVGGEPGMFWAREGAVSVGLPPDRAPVPPEVLALLAAWPDAVVLMLAGQMVGGPHGAQ
jgi:hypothetical protein